MRLAKTLLYIILTPIALALFAILIPISWLLVSIEYGLDYRTFKRTGLTIDRSGNYEFEYLLNLTLIKKNGYKFGNIDETISSVLGRNIQSKTLSLAGKVLVCILTEKHCINAIEKL